jgi:hypothetical protein
MEYTEAQLAEFKEEFARRKRRQWRVAAVVVIAALAMFLALDRFGRVNTGAPPTALLVLFFVVVIGTMIFSIRNWRCPACDRYLGRNTRINFCPKCGVPLR